MLKISQYNKIIHDWIKLLTNINGANIRPQKVEYTFDLVDNNGKPISFDSTICMFYFTFDDQNQDIIYLENNSTKTLKNARVSITIIGEDCDLYINRVQSLAMSDFSRKYLNTYGFKIKEKPNEIPNDIEYSKKYFYRRTLILTLNTVIEFTPEDKSSGEIKDIPLNIEDVFKNVQLKTTTLLEDEAFLGKTFYSYESGVPELKVGKYIVPDFASANATENKVFIGETFFAGDNTIKTGTYVPPPLETATATVDDVFNNASFYAGTDPIKTGALDPYVEYMKYQDMSFEISNGRVMPTDNEYQDSIKPQVLSLLNYILGGSR